MYGPMVGSTVVFLHGGGQSRSSWRVAAEQLGGAGYKVCALDLRGHGQSDWSSDGDYGIERFVADLVSVVVALGSPAILIGASFGGHVSLAMAAQYPHLVRALVLCDVTPWIEGEATKKLRASMCKASDGFSSVQDAAEYLNDLKENAAPANAERLRKHMRLAADGRLHWLWDPRFFVTQEGQSGQLSDILTTAAEDLTIPTLIIRAGCSKIVTREQLVRFAKLVPHAMVAEIEGAQHTVTAETNAAYASLILGFLEEG
jgi:pimeloyl-ACP methyl ester carboxylesterase